MKPFLFVSGLIIILACECFAQDNTCQALLNSGIFDVIKTYEEGQQTFDYSKLFSSQTFRDFHKSNNVQMSVIIPTEFGEIIPTTGWEGKEWDQVSNLITDNTFVKSMQTFQNEFYSRTVNKNLMNSYIECVKLKNNQFVFQVDYSLSNGCDQSITIGYRTSGERPKVQDIQLLGAKFKGGRIRKGQKLEQKIYKVRSEIGHDSKVLLAISTGESIKIPLRRCDHLAEHKPRPDFWTLQIGGGFYAFETAWDTRNTLHGLIPNDPAHPEFRMRNIEIFYANSDQKYYLFLYAFDPRFPTLESLKADKVHVASKFNISVVEKNLATLSIYAEKSRVTVNENTGPPRNLGANVTKLVF